MPGIDMYPLERDTRNAPSLVDGNVLCESTTSSPVLIRNVVPKSSIQF